MRTSSLGTMPSSLSQKPSVQRGTLIIPRHQGIRWYRWIALAGLATFGYMNPPQGNVDTTERDDKTLTAAVCSQRLGKKIEPEAVVAVRVATYQALRRYETHVMFCVVNTIRNTVEVHGTKLPKRKELEHTKTEIFSPEDFR